MSRPKDQPCPVSCRFLRAREGRGTMSDFLINYVMRKARAGNLAAWKSANEMLTDCYHHGSLSVVEYADLSRKMTAAMTERGLV